DYFLSLDHCGMAFEMLELFSRLPGFLRSLWLLLVVRPAVQGSASLGERRVQKAPAAVVIVTPPHSPCQTEQPKAGEKPTHTHTHTHTHTNKHTTARTHK